MDNKIGKHDKVRIVGTVERHERDTFNLNALKNGSKPMAMIAKLVRQFNEKMRNKGL